jgi:hypothetical protein
MNFQQSKNIFKEWNKKVDNLLSEVTEEEYTFIQKALDKAITNPQQLPFNSQFEGKLRQVVPIAYNAYDDEGPLGKLLNQLVLGGWKVDLNTGVASKEVTREFEGVVRTQTRQMKVNAIWTLFLDLLAKHETVFRKAADENSDLGYMADYIANSPELSKITSQLYALMGEVMTSEYVGGMAFKRAEQRINEFIKTWQTEAPKIKGKMAEESTYSVIFSRHPADVLRMSDFKDITSCHAPKSRPTGRYAGGGSYYNCAIAEARDGGAIAYLVRTADLKNADLNERDIFSDEIRGTNLIDPIARIRLRGLNHPETGVTLAIPEDRIYGENIKGFEEILSDWAIKTQGSDFDQILSYYSEDKQVNLSDFFRIGGLYQDTQIESLFYKLSQKIPSLQKYKFVGHANFDNTTQNEVNVERIGDLENLVNDEIIKFMRNMQNLKIPISCEKENYVLEIEGDDVYIDPKVYYYYDIPKQDVVSQKSLDFLLSQKGLKYLQQEITEFIEPKFVSHDYGYEEFSDFTRIKLYPHWKDFIDSVISNVEDLLEYFDQIHYKFVKENNKIATLNYIVESYLKREGVITGAALLRLNRYIIDGEAEADSIEWTLEGDENDINNPDQVSGEMGITIPFSEIQNPTALKAGLTNKTLINQLKQIYEFPEYNGFDVFFDIDEDLMVYYQINLDKETKDQYVTAAEVMFRGTTKQGITDSVITILNRAFKAAPKQKLQEFKYITNRWKMFLD